MIHPPPTIAPPRVAFGTYAIPWGECEAAVAAALATGYRLIDTASGYKNEHLVGAAIAAAAAAGAGPTAAASISRSELFITTKLGPKEQVSSDSVMRSLEGSLKDLGTSYVDCYMMHWPASAHIKKLDDRRHIAIRHECWHAMEDAMKKGMCRSLGVSNFQIRHLESLGSTPAIHQLELHPLCRQQEVVEYCHEHGIIVQQYSPLAQGKGVLFEHPAMIKAVSDINRCLQSNSASAGSGSGSISGLLTSSAGGQLVTPADVALMWGALKGYHVAVRSAHPDRIRRNWDAANCLDSQRGSVDDGVMRALRDFDVATAAHVAQHGDTHVCWHSNLVV